MPNEEALQAFSRARYNLDLLGGLKRACEAHTPGSTGSTTGLNGLCVIAFNLQNDPDRASGEWHDQAVFNAAATALLTFPAP